MEVHIWRIECHLLRWTYDSVNLIIMLWFYFLCLEGDGPLCNNSTIFSWHSNTSLLFSLFFVVYFSIYRVKTTYIQFNCWSSTCWFVMQVISWSFDNRKEECPFSFLLQDFIKMMLACTFCVTIWAYLLLIRKSFYDNIMYLSIDFNQYDTITTKLLDNEIKGDEKSCPEHLLAFNNFYTFFSCQFSYLGLHCFHKVL